MTKGTKRNSAAYWFTYQSGLFTIPPEDRPKPAYQAYLLPLVATAGSRSGAGGTVNLRGRLRFRPDGTLGDSVVLQFRPQGGTDWTTMGDPVLADGLGCFTAQRLAPVSGLWRAIWFGENYGFTGFVTSRELLVKFER